MNKRRTRTKSPKREVKVLESKSRSASEFLIALAPNLLSDLQSPDELAIFTRNPVIIGACVESAVRQLIIRYVDPLRVSTGTVIDQANAPSDPRRPQIDTMIWTPSPVPGIFEVGEFAVVPRGSSMAILEIKSSAYSTTILDRRLDSEFIRGLTADTRAGEKADFVPGLGVISICKAGQSLKKIMRMKNADKVVVLFAQVRERYKPRPRDIFRLVNFLANVRLRARIHQSAAVGINLECLPNED